MNNDILNDVVAPILSFLWLIIWKPISFIFAFVFKLLSDVAKNVYGRIVIALSAIIFAYLAYLSSHLH